MLASTKWKVYTNGTRLKRIVVNGKYTSQSMEVELTDAMEKMLQRAGIEYHDGKDLKGQIVEKGIEAEIIDIFRLTVQMRNSRSESEDREYDRLISPVLMIRVSSLIPQQQIKLCLRMQMQMVHIVLL